MISTMNRHITLEGENDDDLTNEGYHQDNRELGAHDPSKLLSQEHSISPTSLPPGGYFQSAYSRKHSRQPSLTGLSPSTPSPGSNRPTTNNVRLNVRQNSVTSLSTRLGKLREEKTLQSRNSHAATKSAFESIYECDTAPKKQRTESAQRISSAAIGVNDPAGNHTSKKYSKRNSYVAEISQRDRPRTESISAPAGRSMSLPGMYDQIISPRSCIHASSTAVSRRSAIASVSNLKEAIDSSPPRMNPSSLAKSYAAPDQNESLGEKRARADEDAEFKNSLKRLQDPSANLSPTSAVKRVRPGSGRVIDVRNLHIPALKIDSDVESDIENNSTSIVDSNEISPSSGQNHNSTMAGRGIDIRLEHLLSADSESPTSVRGLNVTIESKLDKEPSQIAGQERVNELTNLLQRQESEIHYLKAALNNATQVHDQHIEQVTQELHAAYSQQASERIRILKRKARASASVNSDGDIKAENLRLRQQVQKERNEKAQLLRACDMYLNKNGF